MTTRTTKILYYTSTGLLTALMLFSATMYFIQNDMVRETFTTLGFPTYIIYPLAIAKVLGLLAIWSNRSAMLREWAYAGFFFDFVLAGSAHLMIQDGAHWPAVAALVFLFTSYFTGKKLAEI